MNLKKFLSISLALLIITSALASCKKDDLFEKVMQAEQSENGNIQSSEFQGDSNSVYGKYSNLVRIGSFNNGLAAFLIHKSTSTSHWGVDGAWTGDYFYGFIDIKGNVVIEPTYKCSPNEDLPFFEYDYIKISDLDNKEYIIDKSGKVKFEAGKDEVSALGKISEGYFWVETFKEDISGNTYTVTYYSAKDLSVVATFDNIRAIPDVRTIGNSNSTLSPEGNATLAYTLDEYSYSEDELLKFNISDYDSGYTPKTNNWTVNLDEVDNFSSSAKYEYCISKGDNAKGQLATVALMNSNRVWFYAIVDSTGNVLMQPQKNIMFPILDKGQSIDDYGFCKDLCPAKDLESGFWGYIDPQGNWKIQPGYSKATAFTSDGYAIVNDKIVIDTSGNTVLAPVGWKNESVTSLSGKYRSSVDNGYSTWYLEFSENGEVKVTQSMGIAGSSWRTAKYQIKGAMIVISDMGMNIGCPISNDGEYSFRKEGNKLIINDSEWKLVE